MSENNVKSMLGKIFNDIAQGMETGQFGQRVRVGLTTFGSELGKENMLEGAEMAQKRDKSIEVVLIGPKMDTKLTQVVVETEEEGYKKMEEMLDSGEIGGCVTLHYSFPIGVSTVGKVVTPGKGKDMFIATTTGTSSSHRVEAMVINGINGIITAKAMGIENPTVGVLNVDGARQVEKALKDLILKGYKINLTETARLDGGSIMRGNDLLLGSPDVMITDTLTGNILMKMFSSFTSGGSYESSGYGYGPGIGEKYDRLVLILSRASGSPVVANAISYAGDLIKNDVIEIAKNEFKTANACGLKEVLAGLTKEIKKEAKSQVDVVAPPKEIVTGTVEGIDIMELDDAVEVLWGQGIYAEAGMGCTGPIVMVNEAKVNDALKILAKAGYNVGETEVC